VIPGKALSTEAYAGITIVEESVLLIQTKQSFIREKKCSGSS